MEKGKRVRAIRDNKVVFISQKTARDSGFLRKYGIRVDDEKFNPTAPVEAELPVKPTPTPEPVILTKQVEAPSFASIEKPKHTTKTVK